MESAPTKTGEMEKNNAMYVACTSQEYTNILPCIGDKRSRAWENDIMVYAVGFLNKDSTTEIVDVNELSKRMSVTQKRRVCMIKILILLRTFLFLHSDLKI